MKKLNKCVLCELEFEGYGNNASPLSDDGECCDECNSLVIQARFKSI